VCARVLYRNNWITQRKDLLRGSGSLYVLSKGKHRDSDSAHRQPATSGPCGGQRHSLGYLVSTSRQAEYDNVVDSSLNVMAHVDAREGKWRGNWRMQWVASTLHTTLDHGVSSITTTDAHTSAACSRLNWRHRRFKWTRPFRRKTKSGFCPCAITFQTQSTVCHGKCHVIGH